METEEQEWNTESYLVETECRGFAATSSIKFLKNVNEQTGSSSDDQGTIDGSGV